MMTETRIDVVFSKLLLNTCLILTTVIAATTIDTSVDSKNCLRKVDYSLSFNVYPVHHDIKLALHNNTFDGESNIFLGIMHPVTEISMHAEQLQIEFNTILLTEQEQNQEAQKREEQKQEGRKRRKPWAYTYCTKTQILTLDFKEDLDIGAYELSMKFKGSLLGSKGLVAIDRTIDKGETRQSYVTLFEPTGARRAFPCWDDPIWLSTFNISVAHSSSLRAWSNMPVLKKSSVEYKRIRTHFEMSPYISTRYLAIAVTDVEIVYTHYKYPIQSNITIWCAPKMRSRLKMVEAVVPLIDHFIAKNMSYTWRGTAINFIVFPNLPTNFMGNWRAAIVRQEYIADKGIFVGHQIEVQRRIAHAIIRHYIETFNTFTIWFSEWFRNGLALYLSYNIVAKSQLHSRMEDLFVVQVVQPALRDNIVFNVPHVKSEYDPIYSSFVNNKASVIVRMVKHIITQEVFNQDIVDYLKSNYLSSSDDLWTLLKYNFPMGGHLYNLDDLMFNWLLRSHYPVLYLVEHKDGRGKYIKHKFYVTEIVGKYNILTIPLTYTTQTELNFLDTSPKLWYIGVAQDIHGLDPNDWIIFNIQQTNFYRVNYDYDNWIKLVRYLNEEDHTKIHHLNRAQLIDDAYHFMMNMEMDYNIFNNLINYLWKEQEYTPWHTMTNILHYMSSFFNFPESEIFQNHILKILVKRLMNPESNKKKVIATQLLIQYWACKFGDPNSRESIKSDLVYHIIHKENIIRTGWEDLTYCAGLMTADSITWTLVAMDFIDRNHMKKLKHLACTENYMVVDEFLNSITYKISDTWAKLKSKHLVTLYRGIMKKHARRKRVFDFVLTNLEKILLNHLSVKEKFGSIIMNVYSECQISKILAVANVRYTKNLSIKNDVEFMASWRKQELWRQKNMFLGPFSLPPYDEDAC